MPHRRPLMSSIRLSTDCRLRVSQPTHSRPRRGTWNRRPWSLISGRAGDQRASPLGPGSTRNLRPFADRRVVRLRPVRDRGRCWTTTGDDRARGGQSRSNTATGVWLGPSDSRRATPRRRRPWSPRRPRPIAPIIGQCASGAVAWPDVVARLDSMGCELGAGKARLSRALCASMGDHDEPEISEAGEARRNERE